MLYIHIHGVLYIYIIDIEKEYEEENKSDDVEKIASIRHPFHKKINYCGNIISV